MVNRKVCVYSVIIGLAGYAQSGKDTVAQILINKYGFERLAFADKIRDILYDLNPMVGGEPLQLKVDVEGWDKAKQHPEVRRMLQKLGVAARQHLDESIWVVPVLSNMNTGNYVITDVRFDNEASMIRTCGGEVWRVSRPGVGPVNNHVSETQLDNISADRTLLNGGTVEELELLVQLRLESARANKVD